MALDFKNVTDIVSSSMGTIIKIVNSAGQVLWQAIKEWFGYPIICDGSKAKEFNEVKLYGNSIQQDIPEGYTQLSYIESTGTQYIDTGIVSSDIRIVEMTGSFGDDTGWHLDGVADIVNESFHIGGNGSKVAYRIGTGSDTTTSIDCSQNILSYKLDNINGTLTVGSDSISFTPLDQPTVSTYTYCIFAAKASSMRYYQTNAKKYSYKLYGKDSALLFNGIPAKRNSDSAIGMYDLVNDVFYTSATSTAFVAGSEASPSPETPIEIQSVGDKTVNLFDKDNADILKGYIGGGGSIPQMQITSGVQTSVVIQIKPSTTYTVSKLADTKFRVGTFTAYPENQMYSTVYDLNHATASSITITTGSDDEYLVVFYYDNGSTYTEEVLRNSIQLEQGSTATSYEPYGKYKLPITCSGKNLSGLGTHFNGYVDGSEKSLTVISPSTVSYLLAFKTEDLPDTVYASATGANRLNVSYTNADTIKDGTSFDIVNISYLSTGYFTLNRNYKWVTISLSYNTDVSNVMIAEDNSSYTPYVAPVTQTLYLSEPLRKVGTYSDVIDCIPESKNLLNPTLATTTQSGITCTNNGDGTYTLNGTATTGTYFEIYNSTVGANSYRLVGCPSGGSGNSYCFRAGKGTSATYIACEMGSGLDFTLNTEDILNVRIYIASGTTVTNIVFKPMLTTDTTATYDNYIPYGPVANVTRNVGSVEANTLSWGYNTSNNRWQVNTIPYMKDMGSQRNTEVIAEQYPAKTDASVPSIFVVSTGAMVYNNSSTESPQGELQYELATPTTETYTIDNTIDGFANYTIITTQTEVSPSDGYSRQGSN